MEQASIFKNNRNQAVRLPKSAALPDSVRIVDVIVLGRMRLLVPAGEGWDSWFDGASVSDDFMTNREQPQRGQERESF